MKKIILFFCLTLFFFSCRKTANDPAALPDSYSNQPLGASAHDLLSDAKYTSINIQVQYMPGYQLDDAAIANVTAYLDTLCNKPGGVHITQTQVAANGDTLTPDKVALLEKQIRTNYTSGTALGLYILVTDGYDTSLTILGFAYRNTSLCLFGQNISAHSGSIGLPTRASLQTSVMEHELGHILGLVNVGTPMVTDHQDPDHGNHCNNPQCLMYYSLDTHFGSILHPTTPPLDSNCRKDLHANGGK